MYIGQLQLFTVAIILKIYLKCDIMEGDVRRVIVYLKGIRRYYEFILEHIHSKLYIVILQVSTFVTLIILDATYVS